MKSENFDDAIRNKMESVSKTYTNKDIDRVHAFVSKHQSTSKRRDDALLLGSAAMFLIVALFGWVQFNEMKKLRETNDKLRIELQVRSEKTIKIVEKTDTVYVTKYIVQSSDSKLMQENDTKGKITNNLKANTPAVSKSDAASSEKRNVKAVSQFQIATASQAKELSVDNNEFEKSDKKIASIVVNSSSNDKNITGSSANTVYKNAEPIAEKTVLKDSTISSEIMKTASLVKAPEKVLDEKVLANEKEKSKNKLCLELKKINYSVGLSAEAGKRQFGFGISGDVLLSSRWSMSWGYKMLNIDNERYRRPNDFRRPGGGDFRDIQGLPDTAFVSNIGMKATIWQIPVSLNYKLPLTKSFAFTFGAGTDLDLAVVHRIDYYQRPNGMPLVYRKVDSKGDAKLFNNVVLTAGIQKDLGKWSLQLNPYINPQISPVIYKKEDIYSGLRFRLRYNI